MVDYPVAYDGNEPYIFVSYAHKNTDDVLPVISELQNRGFRVWYDAGIETGTEWPEYIAERLSDCGCAVIVISEAALESQNCRREIHYAISENVPILVVFLEEVTMSRGMQLQLGVLQALFRTRHSTFDSFMDKLCDAPMLQSCKVSDVTKHSGREKPAVKAEKTRAAAPAMLKINSRKGYFTTLGIFCAVMVLWFLLGTSVSANLADYMYIVVILGAVLLGPGAGAVLGAEFGVLGISKFTVWFSYLETNEIFLGVAILLFMAIVWPALLGAAVGWLWKRSQKKKLRDLIAVPCIAFVSMMVRYLAVSGVLCVLMDGLYYNWMGVAEGVMHQMMIKEAFLYALGPGAAAAVVVTVLYKVMTSPKCLLKKNK